MFQDKEGTTEVESSTVSTTFCDLVMGILTTYTVSPGREILGRIIHYIAFNLLCCLIPAMI